MRARNCVVALCAVVACAPPGEPGERPVPPVAPDLPGTTDTVTVQSVTLQNVGRHGDALRIVVRGGDARRATSAAFVRLLDEQDTPVAALDTDWDGVPDGFERRFHFDGSALGQASFTGIITIPGAFGPTSTLVKAAVALEDDLGGRSPTKTVRLTRQAERALGAACDPAKIADRCTSGLSCSGAPATCLLGAPPKLLQVAYFGGASPRILFLGSEPDEDVLDIAVDFLDAGGAPLSADLVGDGSSSSGVLLDPRGSVEDTTFSVDLSPIHGFEKLVPALLVTASDIKGHKSTPVIALASSPASRALGELCDPMGFDACEDGVCAPGLAGVVNRCGVAAPLRAAKCAGGALLDPSQGLTLAFGTTSGVSLWDAPKGCVPNNATGRPETAIRLHLTRPAARVVVSTALPETDFDTAVYVLAGCPSSSADALGCNDDMRGYSSTLTLSSVPAGDYTIVVESVHARGGRFGISVEVE